MSKLEQLSGLESEQILRLKSAGINSIDKFLEQADTVEKRRRLARKLRISEKKLLRWVYHADLFRIKGIAGTKAELLEAVGVVSVQDLAKHRPDRLFEAMHNANTRQNLVQRVPGMIQVRRWVTTAQDLPEIIR